MTTGVEIVQASKENLAFAGIGFGCQFISEAGRAEEAECGVGGVVPGGGQQVAEVLEPAQLGHAWAAVAVLGLADERDRRAGGPRAAAARKRQDVDLMASLVLAAGDDGLPDRADREACFPAGIPGGPLSSERLEVRPEDLGLHLARSAILASE